MATLRSRASKGSALSHNELDANFKRTVTQKTTTYQILISDNRSIIEGNDASTPFTITLPPVATADNSETGDFEVTVTNINAAVVTVDGSGAEAVDGGTGVTLKQWDSVTCQLDSAQTGWKTVSRVGDLGDIDAGTGTFTGAVTADAGQAVVSVPAQVANHIRAGSTQLHDGDSAPTPLALDTAVAEGAWETVGATGSGADNIWDEMDVIPASATILIVGLQLSASPTSAAAMILSVYAQIAGATQAVDVSNRIGFHRFDHDADIAGDIAIMTPSILIPLRSTTQDFQIHWTATDEETLGLDLYYKGFITD